MLGGHEQDGRVLIPEQAALFAERPTLIESVVFSGIDCKARGRAVETGEMRGGIGQANRDSR